MKKILVISLIVVAGIFIWLAVRKTPPTSTPKNTATEASPARPATPDPVGKNLPAENIVAPPVQSSSSTALPLPDQSPVSNTPPQINEPTPALSPATVLDNCRVVIRHYHDTFKENPVGNNAEITAALTGQNPRQINFLREDAGLRLNDRGELLDGWGVPFFFHQVSADIMEIRSAGLDRKLWTYDDVVTK